MKKSPRVLLLVDWNPANGSLLLDHLRKAGLDCDIIGTNFKQSQWTPIKKIFSHWPRCLWVSARAFIRRHEYDYVIAWPQVMGMFLGVMKRITGSISPRVFSLNTTIVERKNPILKKLRNWFLRFSLKKIDYISFLSASYMKIMQKRFNLSADQTILLKQPIMFKDNPDYCGFDPSGYLYSVGLSYRDFPTLMEAARKCPKQFVLATTDAFLKGLAIPENVTVYRNAFGDKAEALMKGAAAVIFPLERTSSPAGETTLVDAMFYGKPIITTQTITTQEYITHGHNGLLVPCKDPDAIVDAINVIFANPEKATDMGCQARACILENHTMDAYSKKLIDIIKATAETSDHPIRNSW